MSCLKHTQRKRKDCPDCFPELHTKVTQEVVEHKVEEIVIPKVELKEEIPEPICDLTPVLEQVNQEPEKHLNLDEYYSFKHEEIVKIADEVVAKKIKEITKEINSIISIKHESLDIPLTRFNMKTLDVLLNDGWKLISFLTKDIAKISGLKEDSAILQRVKCDSWKKTQEQYKQLYKESK